MQEISIMIDCTCLELENVLLKHWWNSTILSTMYINFFDINKLYTLRKHCKK